MRCPFCGGLNHDQSTFCVNCGRDMRNTTMRRTPEVPAPQSVAYPPSRQAPYPPAPPPAPRPPAQPAQQQARRQAPHGQAAQAHPVAPVALVQPAETNLDLAPPVPFPPRTLAQFEALLNAAEVPQYTVVNTYKENSKKKIVVVAFRKCAGWQQAATLLKVLKEQQEERCDIVVIQGVHSAQQDVYGFTNGQLQFDRGVRLGSKVSNRYIVETDNGFTSNAVRFTFNE